jgi:hypothetical protein
MATTHDHMSSSGSDDVGSESAQELVRQHPNLVMLGRVGWIAKGIVYALTGGLAFAVAMQSAAQKSGSENEASQSGAVATIADQPGGAALLIAIALGLSLYVLWRVVTIILPAENSAETWLDRGGYAISAISYTLLGWSAVSFALDPGTSEGGENAKVERATRALLEATGGRYLVLAVAAGILAAGTYFLHKGYSASFESDLAPGPVGPLSHRGLVAMGRVGWIGRGLMMGLIGVFLARAALNFDADDAQGLDGSLRTVAGTTLGTILIGVVAVGLIVYGAFCALSAPRQLLTGAD